MDTLSSTAHTRDTRSQELMCPLSDEEANMLFVAKCEDLKRLPTEVQRDRFVRLLRNSCRGSIFDLGESGVGPIAMTVLEDILLKYNQFSVLKLASNILRDKGSMSIASFLRRGGGSIVHIDLRSNDIGPLGAAELFNSLKGNQLLGSIDLSSIAGANRNHIGSAAASFADLIANNEIISSINLESNSLTVEGLTSIAQALAASNISLSTIELSSNTFGPDGAALIGALLPNTKLLHIGFSSNDIGDKGAIAIARGLFEAPEEVITQIEKKRQDQREKRKKQRERLGLPDKDDLDDSDDDEDLEADDQEAGDTKKDSKGQNASKTKKFGLKGLKTKGKTKSKISASNTQQTETKRTIAGYTSRDSRPVRPPGVQTKQVLSIPQGKKNPFDAQALLSQGFLQTDRKSVDTNRMTQQEKPELLSDYKSNEEKKDQQQGSADEEDSGQAIAKMEALEKQQKEREERRAGISPEIAKGFDPHELFTILLDPLPEQRQKKKKPERKKKIRGVGQMNRRGLTVKNVIWEACEALDEMDDEEDTEEEDPESRGICRLQTITLSQNNITEKGAKVLAVSLSTNRFLTQLDISHNKIGLAGGTALAEMIAENNTLTKLLINDCKIGAQGIAHIGRALGKNQALEILNMATNNMLDEGVMAIADGIGSNRATSLQDIDLSQNGITDKGGSSFASHLTYNYTVIKVNLSSNELENEAVNAFISALRTNTLLTTVDLRFNNSAHVSIMQMEDLLEENLRKKRENNPLRLASELHQLQDDFQRLNDLRKLLSDENNNLHDKLIQLIVARLDLAETKRKCKEAEDALLEEIDNNSKLMYQYTEAAKFATSETSREKGDGDFKMRQLGTKITRMQQSKAEADKRRRRTVTEIEDEGKLEEEEEERKKKEEAAEAANEQAKADAAAEFGDAVKQKEKEAEQQQQLGQTQDGEKIDKKESDKKDEDKKEDDKKDDDKKSIQTVDSKEATVTETETEKKDGQQIEGSKTLKSNQSVHNLDQTQDTLQSTQGRTLQRQMTQTTKEMQRQILLNKLTFRKVQRNRDYYTKETIHLIDLQSQIKGWSDAWYECARMGRATKKYHLGPQLPFDFLPEEQQAAILAQRQLEEKTRKQAELARALGMTQEPAEDDKDTKGKKKKKQKGGTPDSKTKPGSNDGTIKPPTAESKPGSSNPAEEKPTEAAPTPLS